MIEYELDVVIGENVAAITAKLPEMSMAQLADLEELERAAKAPRKGLLDAIAAEHAGRATERNGGNANDDTKQLDDAKDQVIAAQQARIAELEAALGASEAGGGKPQRKARNPKAVVFQPGALDMDGPVMVAFADENGAQLTQIPALVFSADDFSMSRDAGTATLDRAIAFPVHGPANDVYAVWLVGKDGKTGWSCRLVAPLATGGGRGAELPAGHLLFSE